MWTAAAVDFTWMASGLPGSGKHERMGIMAETARISLASEPLALGALDGRYRSAVAPLVDHLSEAH